MDFDRGALRADDADQLALWSSVAARLGFSTDEFEALTRIASQLGTSLADEMLASGRVAERDFFRAVADDIGVAFGTQLEPARLRINADLAMQRLGGVGGNTPIAYLGSGDRIAYVVSPDLVDLAGLAQEIDHRPELRARLVLVPRSVMRSALVEIARPALVVNARDRLFLETPEMSARLLTNGWQGAVIGALLIGLLVSISISAPWTIFAIHIVATAFFLGCVVLRLAAIGGRPGAVPRVGVVDLSKTPVYSVIVALRDEAEIVPELLQALGRLHWPRSRLEVKLVCEADDRKTIDPINACAPPAWVEIVEVPAGMIKTKPNALSYALPFTRGDLVVLYDAEDRPAPGQLIEAWRRFENGDGQLACLQSPLNISNWKDGPLQKMFAFEYAALFRRLLPMLGGSGLMMPLGGTSNHFRREALDHVGAWDPYNVTEDADIGIRLARFGYRCDVLDLPTNEDAPDTFMIWLRQRSRWMKGWMHTLLVQTRHPIRLVRSMGVGSTAILILLMGGIAISALLHPLLLAFGLWFSAQLLLEGDLSIARAGLLGLDIGNIVLGYGAFLILAWVAAGAGPMRQGFLRVVLFTPVYWMMLSLAAWRALFQLFTEPHKWEKTPHKPHRAASVS